MGRRGAGAFSRKKASLLEAVLTHLDEHPHVLLHLARVPGVQSGFQRVLVPNRRPGSSCAAVHPAALLAGHCRSQARTADARSCAAALTATHRARVSLMRHRFLEDFAGDSSSFSASSAGRNGIPGLFSKRLVSGAGRASRAASTFPTMAWPPE